MIYRQELLAPLAYLTLGAKEILWRCFVGNLLIFRYVAQPINTRDPSSLGPSQQPAAFGRVRLASMCEDPLNLILIKRDHSRQALSMKVSIYSSCRKRAGTLILYQFLTLVLPTASHLLRLVHQS